MSKLLLARQKINLTQEELSEKSGISVRTIQRIEAGASLKGHTLKTLANVLEIKESDLLEEEKNSFSETRRWLKIINLSSILFVLLPPLNIIAPLVIMYYKNQISPINRQIVSIQIIMTLIAALLMLTIIVLNDWFSIENKFTLLLPISWVFLNVIIILRNAAEIDKKNSLRIYLNFSII